MIASSNIAARDQRRRFVAGALLIALFALAVRILYVVTAQIDEPVYGDGLQYLVYAVNLLNHGVFSCSPPGSVALVPDSYRGPGYPLFIAMALDLAGGDVTTSIRYVQIAQAMIGTLTVFLTMAVARLWLSRNLTLCAGLFVACWPHLISFAGSLMSETLFGFLLILGLWLLCVGIRGRGWLAAASGLAFGCAYLVNAVILFFPLLIGLALLRRRLPRLALALVAATLLMPLAWGWRNAHLTTDISESRHAIEAFVWGSSPLYMPAFNSRWASSDAKRIVEFEQEETRLMLADRVTGLTRIFDRIREQPIAYLSWYLLEKPFALWDWSIVIGNGDIYYPVTQSSPFERIAVLKAIKQLMQWLNPLIFVLALGMACCGVWREFRRPAKTDFPFGVIAFFFLYVTWVHIVFQAEPRYSIAYRPEEVVLAVATLAWLIEAFAKRYQRTPGTMDAARNISTEFTSSTDRP